MKIKPVTILTWPPEAIYRHPPLRGTYKCTLCSRGLSVRGYAEQQFLLTMGDVESIHNGIMRQWGKSHDYRHIALHCLHHVDLLSVSTKDTSIAFQKAVAAYKEKFTGVGYETWKNNNAGLRRGSCGTLWRGCTNILRDRRPTG